jgi:hypothetical protein
MEKMNRLSEEIGERTERKSREKSNSKEERL